LGSRQLLPAGLVGLSVLACGAGSSTGAPPELPVLGSDATCADRAQARPVCLQAVAGRCASVRASCEATCEPRLDIAAERRSSGGVSGTGEERCRQGCGETEQACREALLGKCPTVC
jgi:hypothetical protein